MDVLHAIFLALLQGLTEFLPVSSSAHLILPSQIWHWPDQGLAFDVSVHVGTLLAVLVYFRASLRALVTGSWRALCQRQWNSDARLSVTLILATLPVAVVGFLARHAIEELLRSLAVIATATIVFAVLLGYADRRFARTQRTRAHTEKTQITLADGLLIGCAQIMALIPGTSRSGVTMSVALLLGYNREASARFSMLLSIPTILGAGLLESLELVQQTAPVDWQAMLIGFCVAALSAYACIHAFLRLLNRIGMLPFVIYRLVFGLWLFSFL